VWLLLPSEEPGLDGTDAGAAVAIAAAEGKGSAGSAEGGCHMPHAL
jgi:hypothetical protein